MIIRMEDIFKMKEAVDALMRLDINSASVLDIHKAQMEGIAAEVALKRIMRKLGEYEAEMV